MRLTSTEQGWGALIGGALLPVDDPELFAGRRRGVDAGALIAAQVASAPPWTALGLRASLLLVMLAPLWRQGRAATLAALKPAEREALLEDLLKHPAYPIRQALTLLKLFYCLAFLGDTGVLQHLGAYDLGGDPPHEHESPELLQIGGAR